MAASRQILFSSLSQVLYSSQSIASSTSRFIKRSHTLSYGTLTSASISVPTISINIPGFLADIWEGILKAVPKKKTSHMKKRHRQLAGKALKDVNAVNSCPGCGKPKKAHTLCPFCVAEIQQGWKEQAKAARESAAS